MGNLFKFINDYYDLFESNKSILKLNNRTLWLLIFLFILFVISFYWAVAPSSISWLPKYSQIYKLIITICFEIIVLTFWFFIQKQRDNFIISNAQRQLQSTETNILTLKKLWFSTMITVSPTQYLELAEKIEKIIKIRKVNQSNFKFDLLDLGNLIFQPESKNRILAMFMGCFAAIVALSIKDGANIESFSESLIDM